MIALPVATLHDIMGILAVQADELEASAASVVDSHGAEYARAKVARAARLRGYFADIELYLTATAMAAEYTTDAHPASCPYGAHCPFRP